MKRFAVKLPWNELLVMAFILLGVMTVPLTARAASYYTTSAGLNVPDFGANPTITSVASCTASQPCLWSNPSTWSLGRVPQTGDIVVISSGTVVTYDVDDSTDSIALNTVETHGVLSFSTTASTQMFVGTLEVPPGGELDIGTQANPIPSNITANIVWINQPINVSSTQQLTLASGTATLNTVSTLPSTTVLDPEQYGLGLIGLGTVNVYGAAKSPYVTLATEPKAGDTTLTLASATTGWQVGDKLQLPDTRQLNFGVNGGNGSTYTPQWESLTISAISGNTVTLSAALAYSHSGAHDASGNLMYLPHVVNTTRNVSIHSQSATGTRGYALFTGRANIDIENAAFGGMGRTSDASFLSTGRFFDNTTFGSGGSVTHVGTNEQNRNAVTFLNLVGPTTPQSNGYTQANGTGYQFTFNNNVVMCPLSPMPYMWGVNLTNSYYGLIQDNDVVNWDGAGIFADNFSSYNNFNANFVMRISGTSGRLDQMVQGDGFWFGNPNNYITNNIATAINGGGADAYSYGFDIDAEYTGQGPIGNVNVPAYQGADPSVSGQTKQINMNDTPILAFSNNEVYGASLMGMTMWMVGTAGDNFYADAQPSTVKSFVAWNLAEWGFFMYPTNNVTIDSPVLLGDPNQVGNQWGALVGIMYGDYMTRGGVVTNANIQDMNDGIDVPSNVGRNASTGVFTLQNSYLDNIDNIHIQHIQNSNGGQGLSGRQVNIQNVQFATPAKASGSESGQLANVKMDNSEGYSPKFYNNTASDQVQVNNYYGPNTAYSSGNGINFQVFYTQSLDPSYVIPAGVTTMPLINGYVLSGTGSGGTTVTAPSNAAITASATNVTTGTSVSFTGTAAGTSPSYSWTFGDGSSATGASVSHSYSAAGNYSVTLTASNSAGIATATQAITVTAPAVSPSGVVITGLPSGNCITPCSLTLGETVASGTTPFTYSWVGNNSTGSSATFSTTINSAGSYPITLAVSNSAGTASASGTVTAIAPVVAPSNAAITASTAGGVAPLGVNFTGTASGTSLVYAWNFGDGSTGSGATVSHTYSTANTYTVTLTATNSAGNSTASTTITVTAPVVAPVNPVASASVTSGVAPLAVSFSTTNGTGGTAPYSYSWNFGDGSTSTSQNPSHTYSAAGTYTANVVVSDSAGGTTSNSLTITVSAPITTLTAGASVSATSATTSQALSFTGSASGGVTPYSYSWNFGDGTTSTSQNPTHAYATAGSYTATLTVTDSEGTPVVAKASTPAITVSAPASTLAVSISDTASSGNAWLKESFSAKVTGAASGSTTSYKWAFGDGSTSTSATPSHAYKTAGDYTVTLTITNNKQTASASTTITVNPPAAPTADPIYTANAKNPLKITFTANVTPAPGASIASRAWNFGDGSATVIGASSVTHTYAKAGTYDATLTVTDTNGGGKIVKTLDVTVQ